MDALGTSIFSLTIIFAATTLGSALVFFFRKNFSDKVGNIIIGLASGIMISSSIFGLLLPSMEEANKSSYLPSYLSFIPTVTGFILGGLILYLMDKLIPHLHLSSNEEEGPRSSLSRNAKFFFAVTIHNIPEGISIGLACGLALANPNDASHIGAALALAIGIAIQNFPEGAAVSIPLLEEGVSKPKAFLLGTTSGIVEPIFGLLTVFISSYLGVTLPYLLAIAAGAMIYVTIDELLPEARKGNYVHYGLWSFMIGFAIMMVLEMAL
ncbi:MAG: ZIP family metal transporter [Mollicutes bacterium]|nr:ZIP family metal transporter [Mollicutes bacterium]